MTYLCVMLEHAASIWAHQKALQDNDGLCNDFLR